MDRLVSDFKAGQIKFSAYVKKLVEFNGEMVLSLEPYLEAVRMEKSLNFGRAERERRMLLDRLTPALSPQEMNELLRKSELLKSGALPLSDYHGTLLSLLRRKKIPLESFPEFRDYVQYIRLADAVKAGPLLNEADRLEASLFERLIQTPEEKRLVARSTYLYLTEKLVKFELTSKEWEDYKSLAPSALPQSGRVKAFQEFYRQADRRSHKIVENLLSAGGHKGGRALVVGGFHSSLIKDILKKKGLSYVLISPKITKIQKENGSDYLGVFSQKKTPLDKLFLGEKLFIKPSFQVLGSLRSYQENDLGAARSRIFLFDEYHKTLQRGLTVPPDLKAEIARIVGDKRPKKSGDSFVARPRAGLSGWSRLKIFVDKVRFSPALFPGGISLLGWLSGLVGTSRFGPPRRDRPSWAWAAACLLAAVFPPLAPALAAVLTDFFRPYPVSEKPAGHEWISLRRVDGTIRKIPPGSNFPFSEMMDQGPEAFKKKTKRIAADAEVEEMIWNQGKSYSQGAAELVANAIDGTLSEVHAHPIGRHGSGFHMSLAVLKLIKDSRARVRLLTRVEGGPARYVWFKKSKDDWKGDRDYFLTWGTAGGAEVKGLKKGTVVKVELPDHPRRHQFLMDVELYLRRRFYANRYLKIYLHKDGKEGLLNPLKGLVDENGKPYKHEYPHTRVDLYFNEHGFSIADSGTGITDEILMKRVLLTRSPHDKQDMTNGENVNSSPPNLPSSRGGITGDEEPENDFTILRTKKSGKRAANGLVLVGQEVMNFDEASARNKPAEFFIELPPDSWSPESRDRARMSPKEMARVAQKIVGAKTTPRQKVMMLNALGKTIRGLQKDPTEDIPDLPKAVVKKWLDTLHRKNWVVLPNHPGFEGLSTNGRKPLFLDSSYFYFHPRDIDAERVDEYQSNTYQLYLVDFKDPKALSFVYDNKVYFSRAHMTPHLANPAPPDLDIDAVLNALDTHYRQHRLIKPGRFRMKEKPMAREFSLAQAKKEFSFLEFLGPRLSRLQRWLKDYTKAKARPWLARAQTAFSVLNPAALSVGVDAFVRALTTTEKAGFHPALFHQVMRSPADPESHWMPVVYKRGLIENIGGDLFWNLNGRRTPIRRKGAVNTDMAKTDGVVYFLMRDKKGDFLGRLNEDLRIENIYRFKKGIEPEELTGHKGVLYFKTVDEHGLYVPYEMKPGEEPEEIWINADKKEILNFYTDPRNIFLVVWGPKRAFAVRREEGWGELPLFDNHFHGEEDFTEYQGNIFMAAEDEDFDRTHLYIYREQDHDLEQVELKGYDNFDELNAIDGRLFVEADNKSGGRVLLEVDFDDHLQPIVKPVFFGPGRTYLRMIVDDNALYVLVTEENGDETLMEYRSSELEEIPFEPISTFAPSGIVEEQRLAVVDGDVFFNPLGSSQVLRVQKGKEGRPIAVGEVGVDKFFSFQGNLHLIEESKNGNDVLSEWDHDSDFTPIQDLGGTFLPSVAMAYQNALYLTIGGAPYVYDKRKGLLSLKSRLPHGEHGLFYFDGKNLLYVGRGPSQDRDQIFMRKNEKWVHLAPALLEMEVFIFEVARYKEMVLAVVTEESDLDDNALWIYKDGQWASSSFPAGISQPFRISQQDGRLYISAYDSHGKFQLYEVDIDDDLTLSAKPVGFGSGREFLAIDHNEGRLYATAREKDGRITVFKYTGPKGTDAGAADEPKAELLPLEDVKWEIIYLKGAFFYVDKKDRLFRWQGGKGKPIKPKGFGHASLIATDGEFLYVIFRRPDDSQAVLKLDSEGKVVDLVTDLDPQKERFEGINYWVASNGVINYWVASNGVVYGMASNRYIIPDVPYVYSKDPQNRPPPLNQIRGKIEKFFESNSVVYAVALRDGFRSIYEQKKDHWQLLIPLGELESVHKVVNAGGFTYFYGEEETVYVIQNKEAVPLHLEGVRTVEDIASDGRHLYVADADHEIGSGWVYEVDPENPAHLTGRRIEPPYERFNVEMLESLPDGVLLETGSHDPLGDLAIYRPPSPQKQDSGSITELGDTKGEAVVEAYGRRYFAHEGQLYRLENGRPVEISIQGYADVRRIVQSVKGELYVAATDIEKRTDAVIRIGSDEQLSAVYQLYSGEEFLDFDTNGTDMFINVANRYGFFIRQFDRMGKQAKKFTKINGVLYQWLYSFNEDVYVQLDIVEGDGSYLKWEDSTWKKPEDYPSIREIVSAGVFDPGESFQGRDVYGESLFVRTNKRLWQFDISSKGDLSHPRKVDLGDYKIVEGLKSTPSGLTFVAEAPDGRKVSVLYNPNLPEKSKPKDLQFGSLDLNAAEAAVRSYQDRHASYFDSNREPLERLYGRLFRGDEWGLEWDDEVLTVLAFFPEDLMPLLEAAVIEQLRSFVRGRSLQKLAEFFSVPRVMAPFLLERGDPRLFFRQWTRLYKRLEKQRNKLLDFYGDISLYKDDKEIQNPSTRLYVQYLKSEAEEFVERKKSRLLSLRGTVRGRLNEPVSLALHNEAFIQTRTVKKPGFDGIKTIRRYENAVDKFRNKDLTDREREVWETIHGQSSAAEEDETGISDNAVARELIQNSMDAHDEAYPDQKNPKIKIESYLRQNRNQWVRRVIDEGGMTFEEIIRALLTMRQGTKREKDLAGKFGQGFYSLFVDFDEARIRTQLNGKAYFLVIKKDAKGLPVIAEFIHTSRPGRGTVIEWIKNYEDEDEAELDAVMFSQDVIRYAGAVQDHDIYLNGRLIKEKVDLEVQVPVSGWTKGPVTVRINQDHFHKRVTQRFLDTVPYQDWMFGRMPPKIRAYLFGRGVTVDLPLDVPLSQARQGLAVEEIYKEKIQQAVAVASLQLTVLMYFKHGLLPPGLSESFFALRTGSDREADPEEVIKEGGVLSDADLLNSKDPFAYEKVDFQRYSFSLSDQKTAKKFAHRSLADLISLVEVDFEGERLNLWNYRRAKWMKLDSYKNVDNALHRSVRDDRDSGLFINDQKDMTESNPHIKIDKEMAAHSPTLKALKAFFETILNAGNPAPGSVRFYYKEEGRTAGFSQKDRIILFNLFQVFQVADELFSSQNPYAFFRSWLDTVRHEGVHLEEEEDHRIDEGHESEDIETDVKARFAHFSTGEEFAKLEGLFASELHQSFIRYLQAKEEGSWETIMAKVRAAAPEGPKDLAELQKVLKRYNDLLEVQEEREGVFTPAVRDELGSAQSVLTHWVWKGIGLLPPFSKAWKTEGNEARFTARAEGLWIVASVYGLAVSVLTGALAWDLALWIQSIHLAVFVLSHWRGDAASLKNFRPALQFFLRYAFLGILIKPLPKIIADHQKHDESVFNKRRRRNLEEELLEVIPLVARSQQHWLRRPFALVEALKKNEGKEPMLIADIGTGTGEISNWIGRQDPRFQVVGIDKNLDVLEEAAHDRNRMRLFNVDFLHADVRQQIPLPDNSVDGLVLHYVRHGITDQNGRDQLLLEIHRVVKPGGLVSVLENMIVEPGDPFGKWFQRRYEVHEKVVRTLIEDKDEEGISWLPDHYKKWIHHPEFRILTALRKGNQAVMDTMYHGQEEKLVEAIKNGEVRMEEVGIHQSQASVKREFTAAGFNEYGDDWILQQEYPKPLEGYGNVLKGSLFRKTVSPDEPQPVGPRRPPRIFGLKKAIPAAAPHEVETGFFKRRIGWPVLKFLFRYVIPTANTHRHHSGSPSQIEYIASLYAKKSNLKARKRFSKRYYAADPADPEQLRKIIQINKGNDSSENFHEVSFDIGKLLLDYDPTFENFREWTRLIVLDSAREGNSHVVVRATLSAEKRSTGEIYDVMKAVIEGLQSGEAETGLDVRFALAIRKGIDEKKEEDIIKKWISIKNKFEEESPAFGRYFYAVDSIGSELGWDPKRHEDAFRFAHQNGQVVFSHNGEEWEKGRIIEALERIEAVLDAGFVKYLTNPISLFVDVDTLSGSTTIGGAYDVQSVPLYPEGLKDLLKAKQKELWRRIKEQGMIVEISPTSNEFMSRRSRRKESWRFQHLKPLVRQGMPIVATDDDGLQFETDFMEEMRRLYLGDSPYGKLGFFDVLKLAGRDPHLSVWSKIKLSIKNILKEKESRRELSENSAPSPTKNKPSFARSMLGEDPLSSPGLDLPETEQSRGDQIMFGNPAQTWKPGDPIFAGGRGHPENRFDGLTGDILDLSKKGGDKFLPKEKRLSALIQAERLRHQLLQEMGYLSKPGTGHFLALLNGTRPFAFEIATGASQDGRGEKAWQLGQVRKSMWDLNIPFDSNVITRSYRGTILNDLNNPGSLKKEVDRRKLNVRTIFLEHSESWFLRYEIQKLMTYSQFYPQENPEKRRILAQQEAVAKYEKALKGLIDQLGGPETVFIIRQLPKLKDQLNTLKILKSKGYQSQLPDRLSPLGLENLQQASNNVDAIRVTRDGEMAVMALKPSVQALSRTKSNSPENIEAQTARFEPRTPGEPGDVGNFGFLLAAAGGPGLSLSWPNQGLLFFVLFLLTMLILKPRDDGSSNSFFGKVIFGAMAWCFVFIVTGGYLKVKEPSILFVITLILIYLAANTLFEAKYFGTGDPATWRGLWRGLELLYLLAMYSGGFWFLSTFVRSPNFFLGFGASFSYGLFGLISWALFHLFFDIWRTLKEKAPGWIKSLKNLRKKLQPKRAEKKLFSGAPGPAVSGAGSDAGFDTPLVVLSKGNRSGRLSDEASASVGIKQDSPEFILVGEEQFMMLKEKGMMKTYEAHNCVLAVIHDPSKKITLLAHFTPPVMRSQESYLNIKKALDREGAELEHLEITLIGNEQGTQRVPIVSEKLKEVLPGNVIRKDFKGEGRTFRPITVDASSGRYWDLTGLSKYSDPAYGILVARYRKRLKENPSARALEEARPIRKNDLQNPPAHLDRLNLGFAPPLITLAGGGGLSFTPLLVVAGVLILILYFQTLSRLLRNPRNISKSLRISNPMRPETALSGGRSAHPIKRFVNSKPKNMMRGIRTIGTYSVPLGVISSILLMGFLGVNPMVLAVAIGIVVTLDPVSRAIRAATVWLGPINMIGVITTWAFGSMRRGNQDRSLGSEGIGVTLGKTLEGTPNMKDLVRMGFDAGHPLINDVSVGVMRQQNARNRIGGLPIHLGHLDQQPLRFFMKPFAYIVYFLRAGLFSHDNVLLLSGGEERENPTKLISVEGTPVTENGVEPETKAPNWVPFFIFLAVMGFLYFGPADVSAFLFALAPASGLGLAPGMWWILGSVSALVIFLAHRLKTGAEFDRPRPKINPSKFKGVRFYDAGSVQDQRAREFGSEVYSDLSGRPVVRHFIVDDNITPAEIANIVASAQAVWLSDPVKHESRVLVTVLNPLLEDDMAGLLRDYMDGRVVVRTAEEKDYVGHKLNLTRPVLRAFPEIQWADATVIHFAADFNGMVLGAGIPDRNIFLWRLLGAFIAPVQLNRLERVKGSAVRADLIAA